MGVDDHAMDALRVFYEVAFDELVKEWKSKEYQELFECPSFKTVYTYLEALHILIKGPETIGEDKAERLKRMLDEELEIEHFWKENNAAFRTSS